MNGFDANAALANAEPETQPSGNVNDLFCITTADNVTLSQVHVLTVADAFCLPVSDIANAGVNYYPVSRLS